MQDISFEESSSNIEEPSEPRRKKAKVDDSLDKAVAALRDVSKKVRPESEFILFGKSIGTQLEQLPLNIAIELQQQIQSLICEKRLEQLRSNQSDPYPMYTQL